MTSDLSQQVQDLLDSHEVFLFMKGTPQAPMCRFSARVVAILEEARAEYGHFDVLQNMDIRQEVKRFSGWPTYPQLYVKGQLIGGSDIVTELSESGELGPVLKQAL